MAKRALVATIFETRTNQIRSTRMTCLETVALDQDRLWSTALNVKGSNHARFTLMVELTLAAAILETLAVQLYASHPVMSQMAGYSGAAGLILVVIIRVRGLRRERRQAWVIAAAAAHALKSEMYRYRTSCGPYADYVSTDPDLTLLRRRDDVLGKLSLIRKYFVEPSQKTAAPLGPLSADSYIEERVNGEIAKFRQFTKNLTGIQERWLKREHFVLIGGIVLAAILTFTHHQNYSAWVAVIAILSLVSGVTAKADRYATLIVECNTMPERLTGILEHWRADHGTLDQLVEKVENLVLAQAQAWVIGLDYSSDVMLSTSGLTSKAALDFPASRAGA
jgi:hypothetical protein